MTSNAEIVVDALARAGTRYVFGYPGGQNMRFIEAMHGSPVEFVLVTHEACAGFMADIHGRLTRHPGACLATLGPGATNMTTGVGNALLDRVPLLAFTGQMGRKWRGRTVQMQIDHQALFRPVTKWTTELETGHIWPTMKRAVEVSLAEQPGPVHLDFREDVAEELSGEAPLDYAPPPPLPKPTAAQLEKVEVLLRGAKHPLVAFGLTMNRADATGPLRAFVAKHRLPAVCTQMAKGHVPESGSTFVGVVGRARRDIVAEYYKPVDLILAVGYDPVELNFEDWVPKHVPVVHIDTVAADIAPDYSVPLQIVGDIGATLEKLTAIPPLEHQWDLEALSTQRAKLFAALTPPQPRFSPHHALLALRDVLPSAGLLAIDVGAHTHAIAQLFDTRGPGHVLVSNGWSSMGFGIPAAIGAKLVARDRPVVSCVGDGGFLMMVGEIATAVRLRLPVVFVVLRDNFLSLIKVKQSRKKYHYDGVELFDSTYCSSTGFFGAPVVVASSEEEFRDALKRGLEGHGPVVVEAVVDPSEYEVTL